MVRGLNSSQKHESIDFHETSFSYHFKTEGLQPKIIARRVGLVRNSIRIKNKRYNTSFVIGIPYLKNRRWSITHYL